MDFDVVYKKISQNRENHLKGDFNCIPFTGFERFERFVPGLEKATYTIVSANSGIGKSKFTRSLFIHQPFDYVINNPNKNIKLSIIYFSLEESREKIILSEISKYLFTKYGLSLSIKELRSIGRYNTISEDTLKKIQEAREYINKFLEVVQIVDNIRNPTGCYKYVRDYALKIGAYYDKNNQRLTDKEIESIRKGVGDAYKKISYYKTDHPNHYVVIICDHLSLLEGEKYNEKFLNTMETMELYSSKYCLHMRDKFGFTIVNVQQQNAETEKIQFTNRGESIDEKLEPSLQGLGDSKKTARDANLVLTLFAPNRYGIKDSYGYNISRLGDNFRLLKILKDRDGASNGKVPLFFNGATDFFKELPRPDDMEGMSNVYKYIEELKQQKNGS